MSQPTVEQLVAAGAAALRSGDRARARQLLVDAVRADPGSAEAWLFLAGAVTDERHQRECLERVLSLRPGHSVALRGLASLARRAAASPPVMHQGAAAPPQPPPGARQAVGAPQASPDLGQVAGASPALTRPLPPDRSPDGSGLGPSPAAPAPPSPWAPSPGAPVSPAQAPAAEPAPVAGPLLGRLAPSAATRTTSVAPDPDAPPLPTGPSDGDTTPLLTLPVEAPATPQAGDRGLWLAVLALGVLLMLVGLGMATVALM